MIAKWFTIGFIIYAVIAHFMRRRDGEKANPGLGE